MQIPRITHTDTTDTRGCSIRGIRGKRSGGLSLLESVIYTAILAIVLVVTINSAILTARAFSEARVRRAVTEQGVAAVDRIVREIRLAHSVDTSASTLGAHPGVLVLKTVASASDDTETTKQFSLSDSALVLTESGEAIPITSGMEVSNLVFRHIQNSNISEAVRIELTIAGSRSGSEAEEDYTATAVLRRSY